MNANQPMLLPPSIAKPDIVRRFLAWAQSADEDARAEGASALARAYLHSDLPGPVRAEAALAMTALLDDPSASGSPGAGGSSLPRQRCAAHLDPRAGRGRTGSGRSGASALARADRRRPRRLRQDRRRGRSDGACPPAKPAARRNRRVGRGSANAMWFSRSSAISRSIFRRNCSVAS